MKNNILVKQATPKTFKLGLEKQGLSMFENGSTTFEIPFINQKFKHGLDKEDLKVVEEHYGAKFDNREDYSVWSNLLLTLDHTINSMDVDTTPKHILTLSVAKVLGIAAPSLEESKSPMKDYKFVVYNENEEVEIKESYYEKYDSAIVEIAKLKTTSKYLLAVAKFLLPSNSGIEQDTSKAYTKLREYIDGNNTSTKTEAVDNFLRTISMDKKELFVVVDFREAYKKNIIRKNNKQVYFNPTSQTEYGRNEEEVVKFLSNPKNQDELGTGAKADADYSIRKLLKNY